MTKQLTVAVLTAFGTACALQAQPKQMNVVFILADDLGWSDVTFNHNTTFYKTPNLERLAARGMVFSQAYSASPLSSPTRASILTGQTPARTGITAPVCHVPEVRMKPSVGNKAAVHKKTIDCESATRLSTDLPTLSKLLRQAGYQTAHFGKWHLGMEPYSALQHGFQIDIPHWWGPGPAGSYVAPWKYPPSLNFQPRTPDEHIEERMTYEATRWLRNLNPNEPFYLNYWQFSVHGPFDAKKEYIDLFREDADLSLPHLSPTYAAMIKSMDDAVGGLLDEIDRQGLADNTIIIFYSDNGGNGYSQIAEKTVDGREYVAVPTNNSPLRGGKATVFEGGVRVPCVVVWPGVVKPGTRTDARIQSTDFYPTLLTALGINPPKEHKIDGVNITPALQGKKFERKPMFTFFPHSPGVPDWLPPSMAVHSGDWKLIRVFGYGEKGGDQLKLYNLKNDIGEKNDLAASNPKKTKELNRLIDDNLAETKPVLPIVNPAFNPARFDPSSIGVQTNARPPANKPK